MSIVPIKLISKRDTAIAYFSSVALKNYESILADANDFLHPTEIKYYLSLNYLKRQKSYMLGRYVCKQVLSHYLKHDNLKEIEIVSGIFGQPVVRSLSNKIPGISLSHNDTHAIAVAFPEIFPISIDIETIDRGKIQIMQNIFTEKEIEFIKVSLIPDEILSTLFWTAKEALSKVIKCGLMVPLKVLEIDTDYLNTRINCQNTYMNLTFINFPFYTTYSWIINDQVVSFVLPKDMKIEINVAGLVKTFCDN